MSGRIDDPDLSKTPKREAGYTTAPGPARLPDGARCGNCAHFIPAEQTTHGAAMCKVVAGAIEADAACREFYADVGFFADNDFEGEIGPPRLSMTLDRGEFGSWTPADLRAFIRDVNRAYARVREDRR